MKGDFSRSTFRREKHYSSVRTQQGRVQVDADWNEQVDIMAHREDTTRRDVIGLCGGPQGKDADGNDLAGFLIDAGGSDLFLSAGRYYVDGMLCENEESVSILQQPDLPDLASNTLHDVIVPKLAAGDPIPAGTYLAYLDVWQRLLTTLEDKEMHEVALGGPDTATRTKTTWQVKLLQVTSVADGAIDCTTALTEWDTVTAASTGMMTAEIDTGAGTETPPCIVPAQGGYRGLENQLYRVEVHQVNSANEIMIKWSRENGSVVFKWESQDSLNANKLTLQSTGRDQALGLSPQDWVELTDDRHELRGEPGLLVKIQAIDGNVITVNKLQATDGSVVAIDPTSSPIRFTDFPLNPKVRRWDWSRPKDMGARVVNLSQADNATALENGIRVHFDFGIYRVGDYWLVPARTIDHTIEWPKQADGKTYRPQLPHGTNHHYCRLAILDFKETTWSRRNDCRRLFPPLTELLHFYRVGGDGQEAMPIAPDLPQPLEVAVLRGDRPVNNARVRFRILTGSGQLQGGGSSDDNIEVSGSTNGIYACNWRLSSAPHSQRVEATLLDADGNPLVDSDGNPLFTPLHFNASLSTADQVAYDANDCINPDKPQTVQQALDQLCANYALYYVGGDGQTAAPGKQLPQRLEVRVANGRWPVAKQKVTFSIVAPGAGNLTTDTETGQEASTITDPHGLAWCEWQLDATHESQQVEAFLPESEGLPIHFNAQLDLGQDVDPGIHVTRIDLSSNGQLQNDSLVPINTLEKGLTIYLDPPLVSRPAHIDPVCLVTVHLPYPFNAADRELFGPNIVGFQPIILRASTDLGSRRIDWIPGTHALNWLRQVLAIMKEREQGDRLLASLTLNGNFIWSASDGEGPRRYLDGEVFGQLRNDNGTAIVLPSGDGRRGGELAMWFYITEGQIVPAIGMIWNLGSDLATAQIQEGVNLAIVRAAVAQSGLLPEGYQVDSIQFDPNHAKQLLAPLLEAGQVLEVYVSREYDDLAQFVATGITEAVSLELNLNVFATRPVMMQKLSAVITAGVGPSLIFGDESLANALQGAFPGAFDGSIMRL